jgi:hypothetical protein
VSDEQYLYQNFKMKRLQLIACMLISGLIFSCHNNERKVDTYENIKKDLKGVEHKKVWPLANPDEFESEVNNGGLNQYFFNSSGQNCFATLRYFQKNEMPKKAKILEEAINLINPNKLPEKVLIENLRKRMVAELDDSIINAKLDRLDNEYYNLEGRD